jgi:hypothetical protein
MLPRETIYENVEWIKKSQDKVKPRIFVNMTLGIYKKKKKREYIFG